MTGLLISSDNSEFSEDLYRQIARFIADINFDEEKPDVIIVDENAAQKIALRRQYPNVPIIYLSDNTNIEPDYLDIMLKKPIKLTELLDIIQAANHRLDNSQKGFLNFNRYELHPKQKELVDLVSGKIIKLTEKEVDVIKYLYKNFDKYVSKSDLQTHVWQYNEDVATHTIETHIYRLRQKIESESSRPLIITENGAYKLVTGK